MNPNRLDAPVFEKLARFIFRFAWAILALAAALTVAAYQQAVKLKVDTNLQALMPAGVASVENLNKVLDKTGSFASAMVVLTSPDPDAAVRFAEALRRRVLLELDWVASADYSEDFSLFEAHKLLYLSPEDLETLKNWAADQAGQKRDEIIRQLAGLPVNITLRTQPGPQLSKTQIDRIREMIEDPSSPVLSRGAERVFQSEDKQVTLLVVWPRESDMSLTTSKQILSDLRRVAAETNPKLFHPDLTAEIGGRIYNRVVQFDAIMADVNQSGTISIALILLLLLVYYRSWLAIGLIVIPLGMGIVWTMGVAELAIGSLNLVTVFLVLIIFGLGIDFGIHNLARYREARLAGVDPRRALVTIFRRTGSATLLAAITTIVGFYALLVTDFRAFYEFGFIAGTGVLLTFVSTYVVLPPLLGLAERYRLFKPRAGLSLPVPAKARVFPHPKGVLAGLGFFFAACLVFAARVEFENDFGKLQAERSPEHERIQQKISKVFPDGTDRAVLIVDTLAEAKAVTSYLKDYIAADTETPTIRKVDSIFSYIPAKEEQKKKLEKIKDIQAALGGTEVILDIAGLSDGDLQKYLNIDEVRPEDLPEGLKRVYQGLPDTPGFLIYIFNAVSMNRADLAQAFSDDIRNITVNGKTYHPAAEALIFVDMMNLMKAEAALAILAVTAATFIALMIFLRSFVNSLIVIAPTLAGLLILFAVMGLFGIHLSIFNMVVLPTLIGIGVDNGIHIFHRFREERGNVLKALLTTAGAVGAATITTALGFSGMLTAEVNGLRSLGLLAVVGFGACLFTSWTLLPALLSLKLRVRDPEHIAFEPEKDSPRKTS